MRAFGKVHPRWVSCWVSFYSEFDRGLIKVVPTSEKIILDSTLEEFPEYWRLNGHRLMVSLTPDQKDWLQLHWNQHTDNNHG